jgi:Cdc6-like AAA superfamily ATPase
MLMASRTTVMNAFCPASEVDDPLFFVGREKQVRQLTDSLRVKGSIPVIYGPRGLGKTSLALQLERIAKGDVELLAELDSQNLALAEDERLITFYMACTDEHKNFVSLLEALLQMVGTAASLETPTQALEFVDRTTTLALSAKFVSVERTTRFERDKTQIHSAKLSIPETFAQQCSLFSETTGRSLLFIIDELDRVRSTKGLAGFLKANSSAQLRFVLVGISGDVTSLVDDHLSLGRSLEPVQVPRMVKSELQQIIDRAYSHLSRNGIGIRFSGDARSEIAKLATGFPWFVHVLGQAALMRCFDESRRKVELEDVLHSLQGLMTNRFSQQFRDLYQRAVRDSPSREIVLRVMAGWRDADIPIREVYRIVKENFNVSNPSVYKTQLLSQEYGDVIYAPASHKAGLVRFSNEMFKAYIRMTPSLFNEVESDVADALRREQQ